MSGAEQHGERQRRTERIVGLQVVFDMTHSKYSDTFDNECDLHRQRETTTIGDRGTASSLKRNRNTAPSAAPSTPPRHVVQPAEAAGAAGGAEEGLLGVLPARPSSPRSSRIPSPSLSSVAEVGAAQARNGSRSVSCSRIDELGRRRSRSS